MSISVKYFDNNILIKISGAFNTVTSLHAQPIFNELTEHIDRNIIIDLSKATRIDTSGIGALVFLFKRLRMAGYALELIGLHGQPLRKLKSLGLNQTMLIHPIV
ncbi:STAS domain-containing protein [Fluoribacter gormanii]|uniref:Anti-anti-sigma regulatory factor (Antagonist of anti-sigma factor) n=1 Tax=Fluoribacter gormanii TaxID=464 RepID=A0A377GP12_9GAMM|nr:STAS domain-containing protein [Fluoribacter gormanii]KTD04755.1 STAS domain protein [Fluoribacter gormanii]MCW8445391.1 STAS domain-containing protein [Fluoribacter gormanii]MCW8470596.1 STAS domain-containing protein [Fluoribacter gormanii]SIR15628.1 anti-sigma B factor antagonist [Fluoribacter gormanii]STO26245.1 Anti-anti-sigma regulatory factor (antagonist of anti-sigma factor) [Fluoribacter gormanii]